MPEFFQTPNSLSGPFIARRLVMPDDALFLAAVSAALLSLTEQWNWESYGTVTPYDASEYAFSMVYQYWQEGNWLMPGIMYPYAGSIAPANTLWCDGMTYNRADYPALYDALDPAFIISPLTFRTPDMTGRVPMGANTTHLVGEVGGEEKHILTVGELAGHTHTDAGHLHTVTAAGPNLTTIGPGVPEPTAVPAPFSATSTGNAAIQPTGGDAAHNNLQPYLAVKYVIVAL